MQERSELAEAEPVSTLGVPSSKDQALAGS